MAEIITDLGGLDNRSAVSFLDGGDAGGSANGPQSVPKWNVDQGQINPESPNFSCDNVLNCTNRPALIRNGTNARAMLWANGHGSQLAILYHATSKFKDLHT